jgi:hypothetical protein
MPSETPEHVRLKEIMCEKLEEWFGVSLAEYQSSGHELDVLSISTNGVKLMIEIIWTPSAGNFFRDMTILYQSDAQIKVLIVNQEILSNPKLVREFQKARISERQKGYSISPMINGNRILTDANYLNTDVRNQIIDLVGESRLSLEIEIERLGERILSNEPISPILAKCLEISKKIEVNPNYVLWLNNELYGYGEYTKDKPSLSEPEDFPNNPDYRKLRGELRAGFTDEETGKTQLERFDKKVFLGLSAGAIEGFIDDSRNSVEFRLFMPADPILQKNFNVTKVPFSELKKCMQELRLRLHKYLNEELIPKLR